MLVENLAPTPIPDGRSNTPVSSRFASYFCHFMLTCDVLMTHTNDAGLGLGEKDTDAQIEYYIAQTRSQYIDLLLIHWCVSIIISFTCHQRVSAPLHFSPHLFSLFDRAYLSLALSFSRPFSLSFYHGSETCSFGNFYV